jgi:hypothetical protein
MQRHADTHRRGGYDEIKSLRNVSFGLAADLPAQGIAGDVYFATDTNVLYIYNGSAWRSIATT